MTEIEYEDLATLAGREFGQTEWFVVDQDRIARFASATDDHQWIHVDRERATQENGGTIAHGFLTLSLLTRLSDDLLRVRGISQVLNMGTNRVRFVRAVCCGDRIRLGQRIKAVSPRAGGMEVVMENVVESDRDEGTVVCVAETVMLYRAVASETDA